MEIRSALNIVNLDIKTPRLFKAGAVIGLQYLPGMKRISETKALDELSRIRSRFASSIRVYETSAKKCGECKTPGICCLDEHFVNVRITRIEAEAIVRELAKLGNKHSAEVADRTVDTIKRFGLNDCDDASEKTFACPLFEPGTGCLVHTTAKPLPCIAHACYEQQSDLPPENLLASAEKEVARLNERVYGRKQLLSSLPVAVSARLKKSALDPKGNFTNVSPST